MSRSELKDIARERIAETMGNLYAFSADAAPLIEVFAHTLAQGGMVILDSRTQVIDFRNGPGQTVADKNKPI